MVPRSVFRYAVCGAANLVLGWVIYTLLYRYVVAGRYVDLGFVVMSPHISSLCIQFVITFFTGFWLNRHVTFSLSSLSGTAQMTRYVLQVCGSFLLNYAVTKLLVEILGIYPPLAKPLTDAIVVVYSYLTARFFTFRPGDGNA